jgi:hypothetical protein
MQITIFEGELKMGDGKGATMLFAQDFQVVQCAVGDRRLTVECSGVEILGPEAHREISAHAVYLDHTLVGRLSGDRAEFTILPEVAAGAHRVAIHVSPFPGAGLCDDFVLKRVEFECRE